MTKSEIENELECAAEAMIAVQSAPDVDRLIAGHVPRVEMVWSIPIETIPDQHPGNHMKCSISITICTKSKLSIDIVQRTNKQKLENY